jgi:hypothetical protein
LILALIRGTWYQVLQAAALNSANKTPAHVANRSISVAIAKGFDQLTDVEDNLQFVKNSTALLSKRAQ